MLLQEGDHFQGLKVGSRLTLGNELSKETHMLTKQESLLGRGTRVGSRRVREPRRTALPHGLKSGFTMMGLVSRLSLTNHSDSESFLVNKSMPCSAKMDASRKTLGGGWTRGVIFLTFPELTLLMVVY